MAKTLHYDFLTNPRLDNHTTGTSTPDLSITRATKATMVDADGYIREVQSGEARFTGATWAHNLLTSSQDFDVATTAWSNVAGGTTDVPTLDADQTVSDPDGGTNASTMTFGATTGGAGHYSLIRQNITTIPTGLSRSVYLKANAAGDVGKTVHIYGNGANNSTATVLTSEWQRVENTHQSDNITIGVLGTSFTGGVSQAAVTVDIYGAQLEASGGRTTPGTYVATTSSAASSLTGTSTKGLLVEEARTNICLQSENFTLGATWTNAAGISVSVDQAVAPDGASTADELVEDTSTGGHAVQQTITATTTVKHAYSVYLKANTRTWALVYIDGESEGVYFDLTNGVTGTVLGSPDDYGIEDAGNGWYRCWIAVTETDTNVVAQIYIASGDNGFSYTGDGSSSIYMWGAQVEVGAFPTSYIPTTTASVTRNADDVGTTDVSWLRDSNALDGTFYTQFGVTQIVNTNHGYWQVSSGSSSKYITLRQGTDDSAINSFQSGKDTVAFSIVQNYSVGDSPRIAIRIAEDDCASYADGVAKGSDSTYDPFDGITEFEIGRRFGGDSSTWSGHIAEIAYFDTRLPNATLESYSTNGLPTIPEGFLYPRDAMPTDEARFHTYITESGVTQTGDLQTDYRNAMASALGLTPSNDYSLNDLAKRLDEQ